ncbi:MAG: hypothetical protein HY687_00780 [Chloroflexi bacterium]|nr:hypothetical protein [Chloroflexota bacterium]
MTNSAVSDFELNKRWPWPKARRALALALGCTEVELFPDSQEKEGERHES